MLLLLFLTALLIILYAYFIDNLILASIAFIILIFTCFLFYFKINYNNIESFTSSSTGLIPYDMFYTDSSVELQNLAYDSLQSVEISKVPSVKVNLGIFIYLPNAPVVVGQTISVSIYLNIDNNLNGNSMNFARILYYNSSILTYISSSYSKFNDIIRSPVILIPPLSNNLDAYLILQTTKTFPVSRGANKLYTLTFTVNSSAKLGIQNALSANLYQFPGDGLVAKVADFTTNQVTGFTDIGQLLIYSPLDIIAQEDGSRPIHALQKDVGAYIYIPNGPVYPGQKVNIIIYANTGRKALGSAQLFIKVNNSVLTYNPPTNLVFASPFQIVLVLPVSSNDAPFTSGSTVLSINCQSPPDANTISGSSIMLVTLPFVVAGSAMAGVSGAVTGTLRVLTDLSTNPIGPTNVAAPVADCYSTPATGFSKYLLNGVSNVGRINVLSNNLVQSKVGGYIYIPNGPVYPGQKVNIMIYANTGSERVGSFDINLFFNSSLLTYNDKENPLSSQFGRLSSALIMANGAPFDSGLKIDINCRQPVVPLFGSKVFLFSLTFTISTTNINIGINDAICGIVQGIYNTSGTKYLGITPVQIADFSSTPATGFTSYSLNGVTNVGRLNVVNPTSQQQITKITIQALAIVNNALTISNNSDKYCVFLIYTGYQDGSQIPTSIPLNTQIRQQTMNILSSYKLFANASISVAFAQTTLAKMNTQFGTLNTTNQQFLAQTSMSINYDSVPSYLYTCWNFSPVIAAYGCSINTSISKFSSYFTRTRDQFSGSDVDALATIKGWHNTPPPSSSDYTQYVSTQLKTQYLTDCINDNSPLYSSLIYLPEVHKILPVNYYDNTQWSYDVFYDNAGTAQWSYPIAIGLDESRLATYTSTVSTTQSGGGTTTPATQSGGGTNTPSLPIDSPDSVFISAITGNGNRITPSSAKNTPALGLIIGPSIIGGLLLILFIVYIIKNRVKRNRIYQIEGAEGPNNNNLNG